MTGEYDEIYLAYNVFKNALSQVPTLEKLLPLSAEAMDIDDNSEDGISQEFRDYTFEPEMGELLRNLIPRTVNFKIYFFAA